jgi:hypothetical protein
VVAATGIISTLDDGLPTATVVDQTNAEVFATSRFAGPSAAAGHD